MTEAPPQLEKLLKAQAIASRIDIVPDVPLELHCQSGEYPDATFLAYWPYGSKHIHILVPKRFAQGRARYSFYQSPALFRSVLVLMERI